MHSRRTRPAARPAPATPDPTGDDTTTWTTERIRALGATTDLTTAAAILGVSRSAAYKLARRDAFPLPLLRVGAHYRVPTAPLLAALHLPPATDRTGSGTGNDPPSAVPQPAAGQHARGRPSPVRSGSDRISPGTVATPSMT